MLNNNSFISINYNDIIYLSKEQLIQFFEEQKKYTIKLQTENQELREQSELLSKQSQLLKDKNKQLEDKIVLIEGQLIILKNKIYHRKSEKSSLPKTEENKPKNQGNKTRKKRDKTTLRPSERYPDATMIERHIEFKDLPTCSCCQATMKDSGMTEDSEYLTVEPKKYYIILQRRHKYRCGQCYGSLKTAPCPPRILSGSAYSDEMITDVALSKYGDLIPVERYATIAGREDFKDLPPNSLIGTTHKLAEFIEGAYRKVKEEISSSELLHADETPHRMLEGDAKKSWYLWGFSNAQSCYFEIRNTRSGDVASEILSKTKCLFLMSDVYSGYNKAIEQSNKIRREKNQPEIFNIYCNAHSRRKFKEASESFPEAAEYYLECYRKIYKLESEGQSDNGQFLKAKRAEMEILFTSMKNKAELQKEGYSAKSSIVTAINYFLKNYAGFTTFLNNPLLPIDNNHQERLLRSPVIGRKTWYGTHSKQGARTAAIFYTLIESCKLNQINPREYFRKLIESLHAGHKAFTPKEFKALILDTT